MKDESMMWTVYIVRCNDQTLYTGITNNLEARIKAHNEGRGAKYTRGRGPVQIVWFQVGMTQSDAIKREIEIKKLSRIQKEDLIANKIPTKYL